MITSISGLGQEVAAQTLPCEKIAQASHVASVGLGKLADQKNGANTPAVWKASAAAPISFLLEFREVIMPEPANRAGESPIVEILPPARFSYHGTVVCDCCHQRKSRDEFDEDAFGICAECIGSDAGIVDLVMGVYESHQ
ncbi:hypothetical protein [Rhizobium mesoamericanum]|uniref:hypothetical protein n=1 Tax=Rhizobium mesoamericanum TaxID=1079800 RepID=UPI0012DED024|nr:hypothetical protein [Rhizobium mesoamericanum]